MNMNNINQSVWRECG